LASTARGVIGLAVHVVAGLRRSGEKSAVHDQQPAAGHRRRRRHLRRQGDVDQLSL